ncbi:MAG: Gfo/Idh/MocA family oxidoreductase [Victivallales bacterium]|nr:Gfo/Idh/MocA family oxidoreductase [Victivallales bacterium]
MEQKMKVAMIGLDTSHSVEFTKRLHNVDCLEGQAVNGIRVISCMRFPTPFQNEEGQDARQLQLEEMGVKVTRSFEEAVLDCDAIMLEINDASFHLEYFRKCAELGKPVFVDKPLADSIVNGREMIEISRRHGLAFFSSSPLRYASALVAACSRMPQPAAATVWGPLGAAPAGSSIIWYGVHAFEMLHAAMGCGALTVMADRDMRGGIFHVDYRDGRRGVVELTANAYRYGGVLRNHQDDEAFFTVAPGAEFYTRELEQVTKFFHGATVPLSHEDMLEVMGMLDAAERSWQSGQRESVYYL